MRVQPGRGASSAGAGAWMSPPQLTASIKGSNSPDELLSVVEKHGQSFNYIHSAAALNQAAHEVCVPRQRH
jgi:hypothetical protein